MADKENEDLKSLKKGGMSSLYRPPTFEEFQMFLRRRPYLELVCLQDDLPFSHDERLLDESPAGWSILDINGTRLIASPGPELYGSEIEWSEKAHPPEGKDPEGEGGPGTFQAQAIATTEYLIATAFNYEWSSVSIKGNPIMARPAYIVCEIIGMEHDYKPTNDDKRCLGLLKNFVKEQELSATPKAQLSASWAEESGESED